jgi:two-component system nitrate/nitrite response regulator NarL
VRLVVGDPSRLIAEALAEVLAHVGYHVASVTSVAELLTALASPPAACVLHPGLPGTGTTTGHARAVASGRPAGRDPAALVRVVRHAAAGCRVVLRADGDDARLRRAGAAAVVSARCPLGALTRTIASVTCRENPTRRHVAPLVPSSDRLGPLSRLTPRERVVLALIASTGASTGELAAELRISRETVRSHVRSVLCKLGVHSRAAAVAAVESAGELEVLLVTPGLPGAGFREGDAVAR